MNAVPFDTLKLARDLEAAGLAAPVAAGTAAALADAMTGADLATKSDLALLESRVMGAIGSVQTTLGARITGLEASFSARITGLEESFSAKLELLRRDMTIKLGGMMFIAVGVILAAMRFMPHP